MANSSGVSRITIALVCTAHIHIESLSTFKWSSWDSIYVGIHFFHYHDTTKAYIYTLFSVNLSHCDTDSIDSQIVILCSW